jgi:hypothetical protein
MTVDLWINPDLDAVWAIWNEGQTCMSIVEEKAIPNAQVSESPSAPESLPTGAS